MKIIVMFIGLGFRAYIQSNPAIFGFGATKSEAVGDLVCKHPEILQITIAEG